MSSILDMDLNDDWDETLLNSLFQKWLSNHVGMYEACGFLTNKYRITKIIPGNYLEWHLGVCRGMNNRGKYCCCFLDPKVTYDYYDKFTYFGGFGPQYYTIKQMLKEIYD